MGPYFSPRVPITGFVYSAWSAGARILRSVVGLARRSSKYIPFLFLLIAWLALSTSVLIAQTPAQVNFEAQTFWSLNKWYVIVAVATFLIQAFLIVRLLIMQTRRRQAEIESRRLAALAESEHKRLDDVVSNVPP